LTICSDCPKKGICQSPCPEAEFYASQDTIPKSELTTTELDINPEKCNIMTIWPEKEVQTSKQVDIANALLSGYSHQKICKVFDISSITLRWHIHKIRKNRLLVT
jgi:DNA-binding NarL/FixJ family response regulator